GGEGRSRRGAGGWGGKKIRWKEPGELGAGGYTKGRGAREPLGALLLGYWDKGKLQYAGHVGSGFDDATLADLKKRLEPLKRAEPPFAETPPLNRPPIWLQPELRPGSEFGDRNR